MVNIVEIYWLDAQVSSELITIDDAKNKIKPVLTKSTGYLIHEHEEFAILAFVKHNDYVYKVWQLIPRGMIQSVKVIQKND